MSEAESHQQMSSWENTRLGRVPPVPWSPEMPAKSLSLNINMFRSRHRRERAV